MKDRAPIRIPDSDRKVHNPFAKGGIGRTTLAGLAALTGAQLFDAACTPTVPGVGGPNPIQVNPDTNPVLATAAAQVEQREATAQAAVTATAVQAEAGKPAEVPTTAATVAPAETKKEQPCTILPPEFCSQAEVINWKNPQGKTVTIIGINLPPGTPIFSPMDGQGTGTKLDGKGVFKGSYITVFNPEKPDDTRLIITADASNLTKTDTKKGDIIGKVENTGIENLGYNVIVYATRVIDPKTKEAVVDETFLRELFPAAFTKGAKNAAYNPDMGKPTTTYVNTFYDKLPEK